MGILSGYRPLARQLHGKTYNRKESIMGFVPTLLSLGLIKIKRGVIYSVEILNYEKKKKVR